jgi:hypothetical protein
VNDIVERLRAASKDERLSCGALYAESADEIERLNKCVKDWIEQHKVDLVRLVAKDKEIEQLQQENAVLRKLTNADSRVLT